MITRASVKQTVGRAPSWAKAALSADTVHDFERSVRLYHSSRDELYAFQRAGLLRLADALLGSEYGRQFRDRFNGDPYEFISALPVTSKATYIANPKQFYNSNWRAMAVKTIRTSGSTGEPFVFIRSRADLRSGHSNFQRRFVRHGFRPFDPILLLRTYCPPPGGSLYSVDRYDNVHYLSAYHITDKTLPEYAKIIAEHGRFLCAYPSSAYIYSLVAGRKSIVHENVRAIFVSSEMLLQTWVEDIKRVFPRAELIDHYANAESTVALNSCERCDGYHIEEDYGHLELHALDGGSLGESTHRIVGTGLHNTAFPMFRYDTGDLFELKGRRASSCEIASDVLHGHPVGRSTDLLCYNGVHLPGVNFFTLFQRYAHVIKQFQLVQSCERRLDVLVTLANAAPFAEHEAALRDDLRRRVGDGIDVVIEVVDEIPRDPRTGKMKSIIRNTP